MPPLYLFNTLSRKKELFSPQEDNLVKMYTCGPTVYSYAHIGNLRTYIFEDVLKRTLLYNGYKVKHVMNITDVGHLTSNADTGEDKVEKAAREEKKSAWQIAEFYTKAFFQDLQKLNIIPPDIVAKATDHIAEDIEIIKTLEKKGFTYKTSDGIYFNTAKLKDYGKLAGKTFAELQKTLKAGARIEFSPEKKNITDFSLWKFSPPNVKRQMEWDSPWGKGFPGWHIECTAINLKYLANAFGDHQFVPQKATTIDIHCGGIDHIPVHHTNEIAQAEAATGKKFVNFWLHGEFLILSKSRMGKSEGNVILIKDLQEKGYSPLAFRYLVLNSHYRSPLLFTWESLSAAQEALKHIYEFIYDCLWFSNSSLPQNNSTSLQTFKDKWITAINDDLNTPQALAVAFKLIKHYYETRKSNSPKEQVNPSLIYQQFLDWDRVFGLGLERIKLVPLPEEIKKLTQQRERFRSEKRFNEADKIRQQIQQLGWEIEDTSWGAKLFPAEQFKNLSSLF